MGLKKTCLVVIVFLFTAQSILAQSNDVNDIKIVINTFFEGMHSGDTLKIKESTLENVIMQTIGKSKNGDYTLMKADFSGFLKNIASIKPENTKIEEKILSFSIKVDGNMANAWTPYEFYVNSKFSHCGVNSFQLFKENENWKIFYIVDTRRKQNCNK